jgi:polyferredoxin
MKLDAAPMSAEKLWRKGGKHFSWVLIALWTGFTFVGYFTPIHTLAHEVVTGTTGMWETFWILFYAFATWGNAGVHARAGVQVHVPLRALSERNV